MSVADDQIMKLLCFLIILPVCDFLISEDIAYSKDFNRFLKYQQEVIDNEQKLLDNQQNKLDSLSICQLDALDNRQKLLDSQQKLFMNFVKFLDKEQDLGQPGLLTRNESKTIDHPGQFMCHILP